MAESCLPDMDGGSIPTSPLQLRFEIIPNKIGAEYNEKWHSVLPYIPAFHIQYAFAAFYNGEIYAVSLWGRPVARTIAEKGYLELRRMAIAPNAPRNTASRMLSWMVKTLQKLRPDIKTFISYQDTEHHKGTIYKSAGWYPIETNSKANWGGVNQKKLPSRMRDTNVLKAPKIRWQLDAK